jgi:hypothetical protein
MQSGEEWQRLKKNFIRGINDDVRPSINLNINLLYFDGKNIFSPYGSNEYSFF